MTKIIDAGTTGSFTWAVAAGGPRSDYATGIAASGANVYMVGGFSGTGSFGSTSLTSVGNNDNMFVTKLTDAGNTGGFAWAVQVAGPGSQLAAAVAVDMGHGVYVSGEAALPIFFGGIRLAGTTGANVGFLASLTDPTLTTTIPDLAVLSAITIFSNSAHNRATIQIPALPSTATATFIILDTLGRSLRSQTVSTNAQAELDLTGLTPGLYAVRVTAGAAPATRRLVVE